MSSARVPSRSLVQRLESWPIASWLPYQRGNLRSDLSAGATVGAMLVPQAMAYALLAGLPPEIGLYASTLPVIVYALLGTSRQLAVGPVAIVSLLTASALAPLADGDTTAYVAAAATLALLVGAVHLVLGVSRLGFVVNFLSHSVLVGFTAAAALIIGFSQVKHVLGISIPRSEHFHDNVLDVIDGLGATNTTTLGIGLSSLAMLFVLKRRLRRAPAALIVVVASTVVVELFSLQTRGVKVVGDIPDSLPDFAIPSVDGSLVRTLLPTAIVITMVGFMESIAVAKVYARRHRYEIDANSELVGLGAANVAAGLFGGYPVTGGFSRTAVNDSAGARTPLASLITAAIVILTIAFLTPVFGSLPNAALGAIIIMAVTGLFDVSEMRHIAQVKRSDLIGLTVAFVATLALGIEIGILVAVAASLLVVFARMALPHTAILGHVAGTTTYRNLARFPEANVVPGVRIVRIDAAISFVNATRVKRLLLDIAAQSPDAMVLDGSGINDLDATGATVLDEVFDEIDSLGIALHLADVKGPVRDVLRRAGLWARLGDRIHASTHEAVEAITADRGGPSDRRAAGIDERRSDAELVTTAHATNART